MSEFENFDKLVEIAMSNNNLMRMRPVVTKELLHYDILFSLDRAGLLDQLTFQGGTSLRLCYGSPRYSEDLDFAGGKEFSSEQVKGIKECLEDYIGSRYGLEVAVKEPTETRLLPAYQGIKVDKWQIRITTSPDRKDLPKQMIKLEVANIPAYSREVQSVKINYEFLPDGYSDMLILVESLDEIMTDKVVSLVCCDKYIRYRDIWDLRWLIQKNATYHQAYLLKKIDDYGVLDYRTKLNNFLVKSDNIIRSQAFIDEMTRFLPIDALERTLMQHKFIDFLSREITQLFSRVKEQLDQ